MTAPGRCWACGVELPDDEHQPLSVGDIGGMTCPTCPPGQLFLFDTRYLRSSE